VPFSRLDNAAIHHTQNVVNAINRTGAILVYLPPYSPDFMPCEGLFSQVKSWIRENEYIWSICDDPELMVLDGFLNVTPANIFNYIQHCEYI